MSRDWPISSLHVRHEKTVFQWLSPLAAPNIDAWLPSPGVPKYGLDIPTCV